MEGEQEMQAGRTGTLGRGRQKGPGEKSRQAVKAGQDRQKGKQAGKKSRQGRRDRKTLCNVGSWPGRTVRRQTGKAGQEGGQGRHMYGRAEQECKQIEGQPG